MKRARQNHRSSEDLRPEYRFDYSQARGNRFALRMSEPVVAVVLEPDVAAVFDSSEAVNRLLRSVVAAMPAPTKRKSDRKHRKAG